MRALWRLGLASAVLGAAMVFNVGAAVAVDTITVTCTNGFERTVAARAARGVATSLTKFNKYRGSTITCSAGPGAPRVTAVTFRTVQCSNGFQRRVNSRAAVGITRALNEFNARSRTGVSCNLAG